MVKLTKWEDINKEKTRGLLGRRLTAHEINLFRIFENIFEEDNSDMQAHQCHKCWGLFTINNKEINTLKKENGQLICLICAEQSNCINKKNLRWTQYVETTFLIEEWERAGSSKTFESLKIDLAKVIKFDTVREMYLEYHKLCKKVQSDNPRTIRTNSKILVVLSNAFEEVKTKNYKEFVKMVWKTNQDELKEVQKMICMLESAVERAELEYWLAKIIPHTTSLVHIKTKKQLDEERTRYHLLIYGQLIELSFIYDILYNLARIKNNKCHVKEPFPPDNNGRYVQHAEKVYAIRKEDSEIGKACSFFVKKLRNVIAHAKYRIDDKFVYKTDASWKISNAQVACTLSVTRSIFSMLLGRIADEQAEMMQRQHIICGDDTFTLEMN